MKQCLVTIRGKRHEFSVKCGLSDEAIRDLRADGIEVIDEWHAVPAWAVDLGLTRAWCFVADVLRLRNPFA